MNMKYIKKIKLKFNTLIFIRYFIFFFEINN